MFDSKQKPSVRDSQQFAVAAIADDEAARSDLTISKHELQPSQAANSSSSQASCYQRELSANTQQSSSIEIATGEAENVGFSGSIDDNAVCHRISGDFVGWLKRIGFHDFHSLLCRVGVTDLSSAATVTEQQLKKSVFKKQGKIDKFLQESAKLKAGDSVTLFVVSLVFIRCYFNVF